MTSAAILYTNLAAGMTPTANSSSPVSGLGWDKLNDPQPRHRARIAGTTAVLIWDLGSAVSVDCAALLSTSLPTTATFRLKASTLDPAVTTDILYDSGVQSNVANPDYNGNIVACFTAVPARYWAWILTGTNPIDIGLAPIGLLFRPGINFDYGAQEGLIDLSVRDRNPDTGAEFAISGPKLRTKLLTFANLSEAEVRDSMGAIDRTIGGSGDLLFIENPDDTWPHLARDSIWGSYRELGAGSLSARSQIDRWARSFRLTERL